ncbi:unnamed protein product [Lupinus luteus]|uniref:Uncharacterized protein n=1 Tax=Lupinus luteus TaxID=3873 RepID=A0AAV1W7B5_LUPLU
MANNWPSHSLERFQGASLNFGVPWLTNMDQFSQSCLGHNTLWCLVIGRWQKNASRPMTWPYLQGQGLWLSNKMSYNQAMFAFAPYSPY